MKNGVKMLKAVAVSVVALVLVAAGTLGSTIGASATDTTYEGPEGNGVVYVQYGSIDINDYWGEKAPVYTGVNSNDVGYFFGGWYAKNDNTYTPIEDVNNIQGTVVAKFVPAQTMGVKCQNWAGTNAESNDVIIRVISATDNLNYKQFGFEVSKIVENADGTRTVTAFDPFVTDTVYKTFNYYDSKDDTEPTPYTPSQLFGDAATRFTTCTVGKIPTAHHGTIICIKPFWDTLDGVRVYGLSKFAHVEDGYMYYVNVPVNLNILYTDNGAAAGRLNVTSVDGLEFLGVEEGIEYGNVFDEMEFNILSDGTIRCVGDTSDLTNRDEMDIYVNLRFKRKAADAGSDKPIAENFYKFTVDEEDFCNADEVLFEGENVWSIIY